MLKYNATLKPYARRLRGEMTDAEQKLWSRLRRRQIGSVQFYRQKPLGGYIVDFYAPAIRLVVEVDGSQHQLDKEGLKEILKSPLTPIFQRGVSSMSVTALTKGRILYVCHFSFRIGKSSMPATHFCQSGKPSMSAILHFCKSGNRSISALSPLCKRGAGGGALQGYLHNNVRI